MKVIEIFGRKLTIVEDNTNTCKKSDAPLFTDIKSIIGYYERIL